MEANSERRQWEIINNVTGRAGLVENTEANHEDRYTDSGRGNEDSQYRIVIMGNSKRDDHGVEMHARASKDRKTSL